jgi:hypothetical protein
VDDAALVGSFQGFSDLPGDRQRLADGQRSACQSLGERLARNQLHDEIAATLLFVQLIDRGNMRMVERRQKPGFTLKAGHPFPVLCEFIAHHLDGNQTVELRVAGAEDLPHAAGPQGVEDFIAAQSGMGNQIKRLRCGDNRPLARAECATPSHSNRYRRGRQSWPSRREFGRLLSDSQRPNAFPCHAARAVVGHAGRGEMTGAHLIEEAGFLEGQGVDGSSPDRVGILDFTCPIPAQRRVPIPLRVD